MTLHRDISAAMQEGSTSGEYAVTVVFREVNEGNETYWVAECLEMPGCISQGDTQEEAHKNIQDAMRLCLSVLFEDCVKQLMCRQTTADLRGIKSQSRLTIKSTIPDVQYEYV